MFANDWPPLMASTAPFPLPPSVWPIARMPEAIGELFTASLTSLTPDSTRLRCCTRAHSRAQLAKRANRFADITALFPQFARGLQDR
jgi:hypothetical protein